MEDESSKWAVLATSSVSGRQSFFAYHSGRKVIADDEPQDDDDPPPAGDGDITFQKVIAGTDKGLDGAVYNIYLDGQIVGSDVTSGGGYIEVHDVTEGLWSFVEQEAPAGYALDPTPHSVYVSVTDGDKQYTVTVGDEELPGIKVIKTSAVDGSPVENAVYSIEGVTCAFSTSVSTGPDGSALVEDLPAGVYIVREESVPEPFVRTASEQTIALRPGKISEARFEDYTRPGLEIVKRNIADRSPIEGVTYQVRQIDGDFLDTVETDSSGKAFLEVDPGSYEISEVNVPSNVIISEIPQTIFLEPGVTRTVRFFNAVKPSLTVIKRNSITKDPLENAKFHIYYASDNTETGEINDLGTYYTDSSGRIVLTNVNRGWYKVVEEESPTGFSIQDDGVYEFYLEAGVSRELVVDNTPLSALVVYKYDSATKLPLEGARFELRYLSGETSGTEGTVIGEYVTSKNGSFTVTGLKEGTYICQELESPSGFKLDSTRHYFTVKDGEVTQEVIENEAVSGILLHKVDSATGDGIYGVTFLLYDDTNTPIGQYTSDDRGYVYIEGLESGRFYLRELENEGYIVDTEKKTVYVKSGETTEITWKNTPITGQIQITKTSADYNSMNGWPAGTPIPNTEFEIYNARTGKLVDTIRTDKNGVAVSKPLPLARYEVIESKAADFYGLDKTPIEVEIEYAGQIVKAAMTNKSLYTNVSIKKTGYVEVMPGQTLRYDFTDIANNSTTSLESFYWRERLPAFAHLQKIVTGTWNVPGSYKIVYKTTLSGDTYRVLADNLSTQQNYVLDASPAALGLASGEKATEFMVVFGIVPANFRQVEAPVVYCTASQWLTGGSQIVNQTDVGGIHDGQWIMATSRWATKVYKPAEPLPRTGY